jgi:hypothetical protein
MALGTTELTARRSCGVFGVREFARRAGVDGPNLVKGLRDRRKPNQVMLAKLEAALHNTTLRVHPSFHRLDNRPVLLAMYQAWSGSQDVEIHCLGLRGWAVVLRTGHRHVLVRPEPPRPPTPRLSWRRIEVIPLPRMRWP